MEYISSKTFNSYARRLEKKNLRQKQRSLSATGISRAANPFVIELQDFKDDKGTLVMREGWREAMREAAKE